MSHKLRMVYGYLFVVYTPSNFYEARAEQSTESNILTPNRKWLSNFKRNFFSGNNEIGPLKKDVKE